MSEKVYGMCDKAWQCVVGCDPSMQCAPRCWARKTVARVVECQKLVNPARSAFFAQALTPDGSKWRGKTFLDPEHLSDPLHWKKPALIATGFHGDIGRLSDEDMLTVFQQTGKSPQHIFMLLTKQPTSVFLTLRDRWWRNLGGHSFPDFWVPLLLQEHAYRLDDAQALPHVTIGCSVMDQAEADRQLPAMRALAKLGWATHVWYEPAIERVDWRGWEFLNGLIIGGESGTGARPFDLQWARDGIFWGKAHKIPVWIKQVGADPYWVGDDQHAVNCHDKKGADMSEWPEDIRVRQLPEVE